LITNNGLAESAGSELYVRDLALALLRRGHTPIAYSPLLGGVAAELRAGTVPVVDDLNAISIPPDIIHGHHHLETMTALLRFPGVPAVYFCHGWLPPEEAPPIFPRILRYVAVDYTCRDRLIFENGIAEDRISVMLNFVDLERFKPRAPLPARPRRALVLSNQAGEWLVGQIRAACGPAGITVDAIGKTLGNQHPRPEEILGSYDIVFARARSALEAMAVGAAVVLCDEAGCGPMVTADEFDRLRTLNFGIRTLVWRPVAVDDLVRQIAKYDPGDAAEVSSRIRREASLETSADAIVSLYRETISQFKAGTASDAASESRSASAYVRWLSPWIKNGYIFHTQRDQARRDLDRVQQEKDQALQSLDRVQKERDQALQDLERAGARKDETLENFDRVQAQLDAIVSTRGWRLLSRYGSVKHRVILPALRKLGIRRP
jgi:hypothetical protein